MERYLLDLTKLPLQTTIRLSLNLFLVRKVGETKVCLSKQTFTYNFYNSLRQFHYFLCFYCYRLCFKVNAHLFEFNRPKELIGSHKTVLIQSYGWLQFREGTKTQMILAITDKVPSLSVFVFSCKALFRLNKVPWKSLVQQYLIIRFYAENCRWLHTNSYKEFRNSIPSVLSVLFSRKEVRSPLHVIRKEDVSNSINLVRLTRN